MERQAAPLEQRLKRMVEALMPTRPIKIILFGSSARGDADHYSDLDVIVVAENVAPRFADRLEDAFRLIRPTFALDILVYTPEEYDTMKGSGNPFIAAAEEEGRVLYEKPAA